MPVSLGDWRVRIGTFVRRERKQYDYKYFLTKLLNLMKSTKNGKQPESNIPERNKSSQTRFTNDANSSGDNATHQNSFSVHVNTSQNNASPMQSGPFFGSNNPQGEATCKACSTDSLRCSPVTESRSPRDNEIPGNCPENSGHANAEKNDRTVNTDDHIQLSQSATEGHDKDYSPCFTSPASSGAAASYPSIFEYQKNDSFRPTFSHDDGGGGADELDCREITLKPTCCTQLASLVKNDTPPESVSPSSRSLFSATSASDGSSGSHEGSMKVKPECQIVTLETAKSGKIIEKNDAREGNHCPDTTNILLLRAGDVELNPGPNETPRNLTELELYLLADGMDPSDFRRVGLTLEFSEAQLSRFEKDQPNTMQATYQMLCEWRKTVRDSDARSALVNKLEHHQLIQLADSLRRGQVGEHIPSLTDEEIQQVAEDVKRYFTIELCQIQADPLNSELLLQFERIFTNLTLMEEDKGTKKKTPLSYSDLLKTKVNGIYPKRLLVEGEGGVGKTTLCAKIAWDWIHGVCYKDFKLVLVILLRKAKDKTVGEIVKSYLSDSNPVTAKQLDKYILTHPDDIFLVLDGLDELATDLGNIQQLIQIALNRLFKSGTVLITSRQWRSDEIRNSPDLRKAFAFIAVEGFSAENLASYITKFFHPDAASSEELTRFISHNDAIQENMAPYPIYTAMLCIMWKEFDGERREAMAKLKTFSQLFDEMIRFLIDHYLSKHFASPVDPKSLMENRSDILYHLIQIGCVAFQGLTKRRLVFSEEEFQSCPESVDTGCKVGVLTREKRILSRRERRDKPHFSVSSVQFPHKLFQEYLSGMYLASIYKSNPSDYDRKMDSILEAAREYQYLLYFTSAQKKEVGLDIVSRLKAQRERGSNHYMYGTYGCMREHESSHYSVMYDTYDRRSGASDSFIVDVAYESQDKDVAKAVVDQLIDETGTTLEIKKEMQAHTIAGHLFLVNHRQVYRVTIEESCGRTASEDLAEFICSSPSLRSVKIKAMMHDVFYSVLAKKAWQSKIETLDIPRIDLSERSSASRDLAQFICKMPHLKNLTLDKYWIMLHDDFYSAASSMASSARIETLDIQRLDLSERSSASRDLAQFICKIPHLIKLTLDRVHDDFFSTVSSMASSAKIETLAIQRADLSERPSASRDLVQFICKMPHLKNLTLGRYWIMLHDDFYSTASSMASSAKIETLDIQRVDLSERSSASRDLAQFICKIPHLNKLTLDRVHDDFYSTASSMASSAKIKTLDIEGMDLSERSSASRDLAQFICKTPHLKNLTLGTNSKVVLHDDFYSTVSSMASSAKIETLDIGRMDLSERSSASRDLAQFICKIPHLNKLTLGRVHDDFFSTASSMASSAKIETLCTGKIDLSKCPSASRNLAQFICKMPHLKNLILGTYSYDDDKVLLHDDLYSAASSMASSTEIRTFSIVRTDTSGRRSASQDLAHFICKMPYLNHLRLLSSKFHQDFWSKSLAASKNGEEEDDQVSNTSLTLTELTVDDETLKELQDRVSMFESLKKVTLEVYDEIRSDVIQRIHLPGVTELTMQTHENADDPAKFKEPSEISSAILNACPQLIKVTFSDITIGNSKIKPILHAFSSAHHKRLKTIRFTRCETDESIDAFIYEFNKDQIMKVEMEHGKPKG